MLKKYEKKAYDKAVELYGKGYIDKAIEKCEQATLINIKDTNAYNLKGIIYYQKGQLELALNSWKINYEFNNDEISKSYIKDTEKDTDKIYFYNKALIDVENLDIANAVKKLEYCSSTDFNLINVNNLLAECRIKMGDYEGANKCLDRVLEIDRKNKKALNQKKLMADYKLIKISKNNEVKKYAAICCAALIIFLCGFAVINSKNNLNKDKSELNVDNHSPNVDKQPIDVDENKGNVDNDHNAVDENIGAVDKNEENNHDISTNTLDYKKLLTEIEEEDYNSVYNEINAVDKDALNDNEIITYDKGIKLLEEKGIEYFYNEGRKQFNNENYNKAIDDMNKALKYSSNSYLREHILFMTGAAYENLDDIKNTLKYFQIYENENDENKEAAYMEEVLYKLAIYNKALDKEKATEYAKKLRSLNSDSMYINSNIKELLK